MPAVFLTLKAWLFPPNTDFRFSAVYPGGTSELAAQKLLPLLWPSTNLPASIRRMHKKRENGEHSLFVVSLLLRSRQCCSLTSIVVTSFGAAVKRARFAMLVYPAARLTASVTWAAVSFLRARLNTPDIPRQPPPLPPPADKSYPVYITYFIKHAFNPWVSFSL